MATRKVKVSAVIHRVYEVNVPDEMNEAQGNQFAAQQAKDLFPIKREERDHYYSLDTYVLPPKSNE